MCRCHAAAPCWLWQFDSLSAAAEHMGVAADVLQQQVEQYNAAAAAGTDAFGKKYYPTTIDASGSVWVGQITPVVHYCMGGVKINEQAQVGLGPAVAVVPLGKHAARLCVGSTTMAEPKETFPVGRCRAVSCQARVSFLLGGQQCNAQCCGMQQQEQALAVLLAR